MYMNMNTLYIDTLDDISSDTRKMTSSRRVPLLRRHRRTCHTPASGRFSTTLGGSTSSPGVRILPSGTITDRSLGMKGFGPGSFNFGIACGEFHSSSYIARFSICSRSKR